MQKPRGNSSGGVSDNTIHRLDPLPGAPARGVHEKADILVDAWCPILGQIAPNAASQDEVAGWIEEVTHPTSEEEGIVTEITTAEIEAAVAACKDGKAYGPDRLCNSWYRTYADQLVPIPKIMFNKWYAVGVFPDSFLEADIFCLNKSGNLHNPSNYRPIALLNTGYKICSYFAPRRTIHEIFEAAQQTAIEDRAQNGALVVLLDFMKAYDSLSRNFLLTALRRHGVEVTSGIRQGWPLAPLMFILALEALYQELDRHPELHGVVLHSGGGEVEIKVAGYADDTAVYLASTEEVATLLHVTTTFGAASGLLLNHKKSMVIALRPDGPAGDSCLPLPLQFQEPEHHGRYLGIYVGSKQDPEKTWIMAERQLTT
ncbi:hypothetical protein ON010_g13463 [Phytophthora cinnamomi]|nr:hypothetical protein ON010_g13463 [Phytophthora cinnamomi]